MYVLSTCSEKGYKLRHPQLIKNCRDLLPRKLESVVSEERREKERERKGEREKRKGERGIQAITNNGSGFQDLKSSCQVFSPSVICHENFVPMMLLQDDFCVRREKFYTCSLSLKVMDLE